MSVSCFNLRAAPEDCSVLKKLESVLAELALAGALPK